MTLWNIAHQRRWTGSGVGCAALAGILLLLAGCATQQGQGGAGGAAPRADLMTESDEPETRKRAKIRLELAVGYFEQGQTGVALDELKQALALDPAFPEAHNLRGLVYMRLNDMTVAEESFRRSLALNPRDADVLHNYGWLLCQLGRHTESELSFERAMASAVYANRAKTLMALGLCQLRSGKTGEAESSLARSYELDPGNPVTAYNLTQLLYRRGELERAQFYIRRLNNSELANAETLWLGVKVEKRMQNLEAMDQLASQLKKRYPQSRELGSYERGAFDE
jgi:type IV pilus assembly protein PilF